MIEAGNGFVRITANSDSSPNASGIFELDDGTTLGTPTLESKITTPSLLSLTVLGENAAGFIGHGINNPGVEATPICELFEVNNTGALSVDAAGSGSVCIANLNEVPDSNLDDLTTVLAGSGDVQLVSQSEILVDTILTTGSIDLRAVSNISVGRISAGGPVTIVSREGRIDDSDTRATETETEIDIQGSTIQLSANQGVGGGAARLELQSDTGSNGEITISNNQGAIGVWNQATPGRPVIASLSNNLGDVEFSQIGNESLTISSASTVGGKIAIDNEGDLVVGGRLEALGNRIELTSTKGILITSGGLINATGGTAQLTANQGGIVSTLEDDIPDIIADTIDLNAFNSEINQDRIQVDTSVTGLQIEVSTDLPVTINNFSSSDTILSADIKGDDNDLNFTHAPPNQSSTAIGSLAIQQVKTENGDIFISTENNDPDTSLANVTIASLEAPNRKVTLSIDGSAVDAINVADNLVAGNLAFDKANQIGEIDNFLSVSVGNLELQNINGNTFLEEANSLMVLEANNSIMGSIEISSLGDLTIARNISVAGPESKVVLTSQGAVLNNSVIATQGRGSSISINGAGIAQNGSIITPIDTDSSVTLNSTGPITDSTDSSSLVRTYALTIEEAINVGQAADSSFSTFDDGWMDIDVNTLTVNETVLGDVFFVEQNSIKLDSIKNVRISEDTTNSFAIHTIDSNDGNIDVGLVQLSNGKISINSSGAINDASSDLLLDLIAISMDLDAVGGIGNSGSLEVDAPTLSVDSSGINQSSINLQNSTTEDTTVSSLTTQGQGSSIFYDQIGAENVSFDRVSTADGLLSLNTSGGGGLSFDRVTANGNTIQLTSSNFISEIDPDPEADLEAQNVVLSAINGIGLSNAIEIASNMINAETTGSTGADINLNTIGTSPVTLNQINTFTGSVTVESEGDVVIEQISALDSGQVTGPANNESTVTITASGDINIGDDADLQKVSILSDSKVNLTAGGSIFDRNNTNVVNIQSGSSIALNVVGKIGEAINPLDIDVTENIDLVFSGGGTRNPIWAQLTTPVNSGSNGSDIQFSGSGNEPPGLIVFNGTVVGGENEDIRKFDRAQRFSNEARILTLESPVLASAFFRHVSVEMSHLWKIPGIEHINRGGGFIFGLPSDLNLPTRFNIQDAQDKNYQWKSKFKRKEGKDLSYAR